MTATTAADTILAIDLGRFKSVAGVYSRAARAATFRTLDSGRVDCAKLFAGHPAPKGTRGECPPGEGSGSAPPEVRKNRCDCP